MAKKSTNKSAKKVIPVKMTEAHFEKIAKTLGINKKEADGIWDAAPYSTQFRSTLTEDEARGVLDLNSPSHGAVLDEIQSRADGAGENGNDSDDDGMDALGALLGAGGGLDFGDGEDLPDFGDGI